MLYNFRISNFLIKNGVRSSSIFHNYGNWLQVTGVQKFQNGDLLRQKCQYSSLSTSRHGQIKKFTSTVSNPILGFVSCLSTTANDEKFQVVITDPINKTVSTSEISLTSSEAVNTDSILPTANETISDSALEIIDTATSGTDILTSLVDVVAAEPSLASLGLARWTPVGITQQCIEFFHTNMDMSWGLAIITCTVIARILLIPLLIKTQKNAISMGNSMPKLQYLQTKFQEARKAGNHLETSRYASEIMFYMKENNISPFKNAMWPLLQAPIFISFFMGLRSMAKLPVETMKDGGYSWAMDLTIPDPYYVLPLISCTTLYVILKVGAESGVRMENMQMAKYFVRAIPVIVFPFCINFPSAVLYYWCTNNICTLVIVSVLKIKPIRKWLKMPAHQIMDPKFKPKKKGFIKGIKDSFEDQKVLATVEDRKRVDAITFQRAGTGPIPRTYSYDPTKPRPANAAAAAGIKSQAKSFKT